MGSGVPTIDPNAELKVALAAGDPDVVRQLLDAGADLRFREDNGYDALIHAVHGRDVGRDRQLLDLLSLLVKRGVGLCGVSSFGESGLRVLSRIGRFDGVELLLNAGADERLLEWTPLHRAVASGTCEDVRKLLDDGVDVEARDTWERTPWIIALLVGDIEMAKLLMGRGVKTDATGRGGRPSLFYPIAGHRPETVRWLLDIGTDLRQTDDFGTTALIEAVEADDLEIVELLVEAGVDVEIDNHGTALNRVTSRAVAMRLLDAGADPATLTHEGQRMLLGLGEVTEQPLKAIELSPFHQVSTRVFGTSNPQRMNHPFWLAMVRAGINACQAAEFFRDDGIPASQPIWCANRFGQSLTFLPDGRAVQIAGEHEDFYDSDFCIYNDVIVHHPDGSIDIFGYPKDVFPPTDFHTATLLGEAIYIIGSLGYPGTRGSASTPIYRLDTNTWQINSIHSQGDSPGRLHNHRAERVSNNDICVWSGKISLLDESGNERSKANGNVFVFDAARQLWRRDV